MKPKWIFLLCVAVAIATMLLCHFTFGIAFREYVEMWKTVAGGR